MSLFLIIGLVVFLVLRNQRNCMNQHLGARPRPLIGGFGVLAVLGLLGFFFFYASHPTTVYVSHAPMAPPPVILDSQEDDAIQRATTAVREGRHNVKARANTEREKVKQMIADLTEDAKKEAVEIKDRVVDALTGGDETVAHAETVAKETVGKDEDKGNAEQEEAPPVEVAGPAEDPFGDVAPAVKKTAPIAIPAGPHPKWLDEPAGLVSGVYYKNVVVGPFATRADCDEALPAELTAAVNQYVNTYLGPGASQIIGLQPAYVHARIVKDYYEETYDASFAPMKNLHVRLAFDSKVQQDLQAMYRSALAEDRMKEVALGAGGVLLLLGTMFSYLKLDTLTRGYYTGRLRVAATLVILTAAFLAIRMVQF